MAEWQVPVPNGLQHTEVTYLVTDVQGEDDRENASGWVPPMTLQPVVEDIFDEGWVVDQDLKKEEGPWVSLAGQAHSPLLGATHCHGHGAMGIQLRRGTLKTTLNYRLRCWGRMHHSRDAEPEGRKSQRR